MAGAGVALWLAAAVCPVKVDLRALGRLQTGDNHALTGLQTDSTTQSVPIMRLT
ncbi:hypothetical protein PCI56_03320 [Plesiomonas shigelloides subsp. oncorhynchi]|nr:hypothetical protein [Plesiomonas shigelloides]